MKNFPKFFCTCLVILLFPLVFGCGTSTPDGEEPPVVVDPVDPVDPVPPVEPQVSKPVKVRYILPFYMAGAVVTGDVVLKAEFNTVTTTPPEGHIEELILYVAQEDVDRIHPEAGLLGGKSKALNTFLAFFWEKGPDGSGGPYLCVPIYDKGLPPGITKVEGFGDVTSEDCPLSIIRGTLAEISGSDPLNEDGPWSVAWAPNPAFLMGDSIVNGHIAVALDGQGDPIFGDPNIAFIRGKVNWRSAIMCADDPYSLQYLSVVGDIKGMHKDLKAHMGEDLYMEDFSFSGSCGRLEEEFGLPPIEE